MRTTEDLWAVSMTSGPAAKLDLRADLTPYAVARATKQRGDDV